MKKLDREEVKRIQIEILDTVTDFCDQNGISYWLDCGTLLGAIRHKGYIPWDDDIDIGMLREDYDKFSELFNKSNERYRFVNIHNKEDFYVAFGKIIDVNTVLYEPNKNGNKLSVNIDLFVYDNAPDDDRLVNKMYNTRDRLRFIASFSRGNNILENDSLFKRIFKQILHIVCSPFSSNKCLKKVVINAKKYNGVDTSRVGNFTSISRIACKKSILDSFVEVEFEGKFYKAPVGYDEWLKEFFGDYMELPPVEKRVTHHQYEAYWVE